MLQAKKTVCFAAAGLLLAGFMALQSAEAAGEQLVPSAMSHFMVLGDSIPFGYMAGYTNSEDGSALPQVSPQLVPHSWPKLVANQAGSTMLLPFTSTTPDNLAVPGYALGDMTKKYSELKAVERLAQATDLVFAGYAAEYGDMSPVEYLLKKNPSAVAVMIGNNDVLGAAIYANTALKTPADVFEQKYEDLVKTLADAENTNRAVVVSTIPDVSSIPFLVSVQTMSPQPLSYSAINYGGTEKYQIQSTDFITLSGVQKMQSQEHPPLVKCLGTELQCSGDILTSGEVAEISRHTKLLNDAIRKAAGARSNVAVMNFDQLFNRLRRGTLAAVPTGKTFTLLKQQPGIAVDGKRYTTAYGGGLFSKDGIHPSKLGHGVLANEMIRTLNRNFSANIPLLDLGPVAAGDELANPVAPAAADSSAFEKSRSLFQHSR